MKPYHRPFPANWWTTRFGWAFFMVREATAVAVAFYCAIVLLLLWNLSQGEVAYRDFVDCLQSNGMILIHGFAIFFLLVHTVTWFVVTPKAIDARMPWGDKVPDHQVIGGHLGGWVVVTIAIVAGLCFFLPVAS